jgi:hypothetical protein
LEHNGGAERNASPGDDLQAMKRSRTYGIVTMLFVLAAPFVQAQSSTDSVLVMVESLYASGAYANAELEARRLMEHPLLSDSVHVLAEQWIAFALVAQGKPILAKEHFTRILRRRPEHELDPVFTSPKILVVFNEARAAVRARRGSEIDSSSIRLVPDSHPITFRAMLFPGWEQLHQGRTTKGAIFFGAGVATIGTGIVMEFLRSSARNNYLSASTTDEIESRYQTYDRYYKAETFAFVAFAVVYLASEIDVFTSDSPVSLSSRTTRPANQGNSLTLAIRLR